LLDLLKTYPEMDSLIFSTSNVAVKALNIFRNLGVEIPKRFSALALGGYGMADYCTPSLAVYENDIEKQAEFFADYLFRILNGENLSSKICINFFKLVERDSIESRKY
jgi:DNA-binding LacI/PurR family transcriptional regulator